MVMVHLVPRDSWPRGVLLLSCRQWKGLTFFFGSQCAFLCNAVRGDLTLGSSSTSVILHTLYHKNCPETRLSLKIGVTLESGVITSLCWLGLPCCLLLKLGTTKSCNLFKKKIKSYKKRGFTVEAFGRLTIMLNSFVFEFVWVLLLQLMDQMTKVKRH